MKFLQFNFLSFGSVVIQFVFLKTGEKTMGLENFKKPVLELLGFSFAKPITDKFSAYLIFYVAGVGVGLIWNFFIYSQVIWRVQK